MGDVKPECSAKLFVDIHGNRTVSTITTRTTEDLIDTYTAELRSIPSLPQINLYILKIVGTKKTSFSYVDPNNSSVVKEDLGTAIPTAWTNRDAALRVAASARPAS